MEDYIPIIQKSQLFSGLTAKETVKILDCLAANTKQFKKNSFVFRSGDNISSFGLVLTGSVHVVKEDFWGNRNIVAKISPGQTFAEAYACAHNQPLEVSALATENSLILFLNARRLLTSCSSACEFHTRLIRNLLSVVAEKNIALNNKITHISQRSTREKLLSYLSAESLAKARPTFDIPFDRQQLADYLSVDRSAMSNELGKLKAEGVLDFSKNTFTLKE